MMPQNKKCFENLSNMLFGFFPLTIDCLAIKVSQIEILSKIMKKIDLNNQTVSTCGQLEPIFSLKYADISCVIALYFLSFFYEHPVY